MFSCFHLLPNGPLCDLLLQNRTPTLIRIETLDSPGDFKRVRTEVLLIDNSVLADQKSFHSSDAILRRCSDKSEATDHHTLHNVIELAPRRCVAIEIVIAINVDIAATP